MILLPMSKELNSDFLGNHRGAAQVLEDDHLAILTLALIAQSQRLEICDQIAYPEVENTQIQPGIRFSSLMRDLTMTGYYTTELGFNDLGYQGNTPNIWDGVPASVLKRHRNQYDHEWLGNCVDQSQREIIAEWDDEMNLIT